ncbi:MAG: anthranilate synthase component I [Acidimicrobiales bacterium]
MTAPGPPNVPGLRIFPGEKEFLTLCRKYPIVPVWTEIVADTLTPVAAFQNIVGDEQGFLLESVEGGERWGRYSFVGRRPLAMLDVRGDTVQWSGAAPRPEGHIPGALAALEVLLDAYTTPLASELGVTASLPPLHAGVVGYLGYDVVREVERLPNAPADDQGFPDAALSVIGELAAFDHWRQCIVVVKNVLTDPSWTDASAAEAYRAAAAGVAELAADCFCGTGATAGVVALPGRRPVLADAVRSISSEVYCDAVKAAKEHITAGDVFQVVLSQRFDLDLRVDPFDVYRALRLLNPSPYLYFLRFDQVTVVGSSPEPMVRLRDGTVTSRPIAGSRPRGTSDLEDRRLAGELAEDPKEQAEHVMLVDLARNDLGRVVGFGTEKVDELMTVERYSHIMHLTSQVSGRLREGLGPIDVLRATLPAGTLSGAPKVRAMEIIDELEPTKRGIYGGVIGYLDFSGNLDTAIAIRTLVVGPGGRAFVQAGAGIVADSDPEREDDECGQKAAAVLAAVAAAEIMAGIRPDPGAGGPAQQDRQR